MKIKISTTAIIIILSTILVGCIAYSIFYKNTSNVVFLNKNELSTFLIKDKDNYYKSFHEKDLIVRKVSNINEYKEKIRNSTSDFLSLSKRKDDILC